MILDREVEVTRRAPAADFDIFGGRGADRHAGMRQIRDHRDEVVDRAEELGKFVLVGLEPVAEACNLLHERARILALGFDLPDLLGQRVALRLQLLCTGCSALRRSSSA